MQRPLRAQLTMAILTGVAIFAVAGQPSAQQSAEGDVTITLDEARIVAAKALRDGAPQLAEQLARGLLLADAKSSYAHLVLATAQTNMGQTAQARKSAAKSYRYANTKPEKFQAAELAAKLAYAESRPTQAQLWLRRAAHNADNEQIEEQLGRDFQRVRAENPLSFSIRGALRPSSNVNNGADTALQIIEGVPLTGSLSGSAQALSGTVASADAVLGYRLRGTKASRTDISARLFVGRVALSSDAKALSPTSSNSDFASTYGALTLSHSFAVGAQGGSAKLSASAGQFWSGGDRYYDFTRLDAARVWRLDAANRLQISASVENRDIVNSATNDAVAIGLNAELTHTRPGGDTLGFAFNVLETSSDSVNSDSTALSLSARYTFADRIGPAQVSTGIVVGTTDYDRYFAAPIFLANGRQDHSAFADLNLFFPDIDYAGFAPTLALKAGRKTSNISRFETREFSLSVGIASKF
ncbi:tetratricopeptide repeat protein [Sulfitobacter guttiformis]|uniref:tetratricopeptide repeat protein n=1 Tax=Sulfitobacter guttiformis TaxID=74349 RepID=UPI002013502A|nr:surface lipoprotein assembly modifier [Sulfitobacter guttiformis]